MVDEKVNGTLVEISTRIVCGMFSASSCLRRPLKRFQRIDIVVGEKSIHGRLIPLSKPEINAADVTAVQILFDSDSIVRTGTNFPVRFSGDEEFAGDVHIFLASCPKFSEESLTSLAAIIECLQRKDIKQALVLLISLYQPYGIGKRYLSGITGVTSAEIDRLVITKAFSLTKLNKDELIMTVDDYNDLKDRTIRALKEFHLSNAHRPGPAIDEILALLNPAPPAKVLEDILELLSEEGTIIHDGKIYRMDNFAAKDENDLDGLAGEVLKLFNDCGMKPPSNRDAARLLKQPEKRVRGILKHLAGMGHLMKVDKDIFLSTAAFDDAKSRVITAIRENGELHIAEFRDMIGCSRQLGVAILERLDRKGFTKREGDFHVRGDKFPAK